ncbi:Golgi-associated kinase 1A [Protopterus annectens]|uniref:Golgi-associated kinase 1A n=1 Tax=Protopterus annectens TaxID=7888 RepID=UPI001CFB2F5F|nr:Golgi-associated kinase 1A [Protopterus annectens]
MKALHLWMKPRFKRRSEEVHCFLLCLTLVTIIHFPMLSKACIISGIQSHELGKPAGKLIKPGYLCRNYSDFIYRRPWNNNHKLCKSYPFDSKDSGHHLNKWCHIHKTNTLSKRKGLYEAKNLHREQNRNSDVICNHTANSHTPDVICNHTAHSHTPLSSSFNRKGRSSTHKAAFNLYSPVNIYKLDQKLEPTLVHKKYLDYCQLSLGLQQPKCIPDVQDTAGTERNATKYSQSEQNSLVRLMGTTTKTTAQEIKTIKSDIPLLAFKKWSWTSADIVKLQKSPWCEKFYYEEDSLSHLMDHFTSGAEHLPWLSPGDLHKMKLLASGTVIGKSTVPGHGQVLKVGLDITGGNLTGSLDKCCQDGFCGLIKRPTDLYEVIAFHLDRVLGINRSLPAVARKFYSDLLPYRYTRSGARPIIWWTPDILHLEDAGNDQNSFAVNWNQYQGMLLQQCDMGDNKPSHISSPCLVKTLEWSKLALFDFLLQIHDRLDRYCCGFKPDPLHSCVVDGLHEKCGNPKELVLVHILVRKSKPTQLVFIDNAGQPFQPEDNLNFRLLEGIKEFPESILTMLKSGCLQNMLLHSLYIDKELWEVMGGLQGLKPMLHNIDRRGEILLEYINKHNFPIVKDDPN